MINQGWFILFATFIGITSCGQENPRDEQQAGNLDVIIPGYGDLQKVRYSDNAEVFGIMSGGCTVTHIGENIGMTAGHCLRSRSCSSNYDVLWGYTTDNRQGTMHSKCVQVLAVEQNDAKDYAFIRYDQAPKVYLPVNTERKPATGEKIIIYSHPRGRTLETSGWCTVKGQTMGQRFRYFCDTEGGSSGAAILNERFEIVGIHNLGNSYQRFNAGTYIMSTPLAGN